MASVAIWTCPTSDQGAGDIAGGGASTTTTFPTCANNHGAWQQVELAEPFDPATLDKSTVSQAIGGGFISVATLLIFCIPIRMILRQAQDRYR